jgi:tRNA(fMet)-specific endonuclease VapC
MILLDTDILTLVFASHTRAIERMRAAPEAPVISAVARIEVLQGRFDSILKAADANAMLRAQDRLAKAEKDLEKYRIIPFDADAGVHFDRLRQDKKFKKIGRKDLLTACIALANRATLVTRNVKDFQLVPGLRLENWAD